MQALEKFKNSLTPSETQILRECLLEAKQTVPQNSIAWFLGDVNQATGYLDSQDAKLLQTISPGWTDCAEGLRWDVVDKMPESRTMALTSITEQLRHVGKISGWRNEKFSVWTEDSDWLAETIQPDERGQEAFRMERAAFRFFGVPSHAVHINGLTPNGDMWCGRRALSKSVDPGMLDNLAAGGLPAGEGLFQCGVREMAEEAGIPAPLAKTARPYGYVKTYRSVKEGWHHEILWVYNIALPTEFQPMNQDGEVDEFVLLKPWQVIQAIQEKAFTVDAACVIAHALMRP